MFAGADLMNPLTLKYFWEWNIKVLDIYGLSETTGPHSTNLKSNEKFGNCGHSINGVHTKIINKTEYSELKLLHLSEPKNETGEVKYTNY